MKVFLTLMGVVFGLNAFSQLQYSVSLTDVEKDEIQVILYPPTIQSQEIEFCFPMTIPGTYAVLDFGRFISSFKAFDQEGKKLKVKKSGKNCYRILNASALARITYQVEDTWDAKKRKNKVFEPAGTNFEDSKNFVFTNSGVFGFFKGMEDVPVELTVTQPEGFFGLTAMPTKVLSPTQQVFQARDYHQLVDCPILFFEPDTAQFKVGDCQVTIGVYRENGETGMAKAIYESIKPSMEAIEAFVGDLPVENYAYLVYAPDLREVGAMLNGTSDAGLLKKVWTILPLIGKGFGALEHQNSSLYYMPEFSDSNLVGDMVDVAIHEFMHIITPLNLHSEYIGDFNYANPQMSEHLWLYEGVTEYFAGIIQLKGGLIDLEDYFNVMRGKIRQAQSYPDDMPFAEMSRNVFDKPYKKQYTQVYMRGAVMGLMLDIEIMRLTNGEKTLIDVLFELIEDFGMEKAFKEDEIVPAMVSKVHPDLQKFFDNYVYGTKPLDIKESMAYAGIDYVEEREENVAMNPVTDNDVKINAVNIFEWVTVRKVGKEDWVGFQEGDQIPTDYMSYFKTEEGDYLPEGTVVKLPLIRKEVQTTLDVPVRYTSKTIRHEFKVMEEMSPEQEDVFEALTAN